MSTFTHRARPVVADAAYYPRVAPAVPSAGAVRSQVITPSPLRLLAQLAGCPDGCMCVCRDIGYAVDSGRTLDDFHGIDISDQMSSWVDEATSRYCGDPDINYSGTRSTRKADIASDAVNTESNDIASALQPC
ncbi:hypothetical protein ACIP6P_11950 [Streptomyces sp. NPDC088729]|uniref:hypothetical protein n=1 Tax=Streptomyces sp. NPDC088729 TaxID=3365876 RepID=UPI0037FA4B24